MFYVYTLYNKEFDKYYIGQTSDLEKRISRHNRGGVKSTKPYRPWEIVYTEEYSTRSESMAREKELKSWKSKIKLAELVEASR
jgi:putative endonuclease